jgi:uncharacterized membrane protein
MPSLVVHLTSWRTRWRAYEYVRNSLWIVPLLFVALAIGLGVALPTFDEHTNFTIGIHFGSDAARGVLGAIASGMITFTGFVFSILLLAVQFGSSQFSPRMLRRFLRDPSTKAALGVFMATFVYALAVLRVVGTGENQAFVPDNSISVALLLLVLSMLMFLRLLSHTTQGLRVAAVLGDLGRDARKVVDRVYPEPAAGADVPQGSAPGPSGPVRPVTYRGRPGIVQSVDVRRLIEHASGADAVIELVPRLGELIAEGSVLFRIHGDRRGAITDEWLRGTVATGDERTMRQDPAFAFRLLADISAKALSPGVNDPTTSTQALDQIELLLQQIGGRRLTPGIGRDDRGVVRFHYPAPSWEDYLSLAVDETRHYGEGSIQVMRRLRALLNSVRKSVPEFRRAPVDERLALLDSAAGRAFSDRGDRLAAIASDHQGLGATDLAAPVVAKQATDGGPRRPAGGDSA